MNYTIIIIIGIACIILGWLFGYNYANEKLSNIEEGIKFIEEAGNFNTIEEFQYLKALEEIEILKNIENGNSKVATQQIIGNLAGFYHMSKEAIEDQMASDSDREIVNIIEKLSKESSFFKEIIEYKE